MDDPDSEINIQRLKRLKQVFEEADEDGTGELDIDDFAEKIGPHLGEDLTKRQLTQLFMKIDADAGGTVDWDEFSNFMFLQKSDVEEEDSENWRFFPQDFRERNDLGCHHRDSVEHIFHFEQGEKYLTSGRDGTFRIWNSTDLKHIRTITCSPSAWVTCTLYMPRSRRILASTSDCSVSFYGIVRGGYDLVGRLQLKGILGIPRCLCVVEAENDDFATCGDDNGLVSLLLTDSGEPVKRDHFARSTLDFVDILYEHSDWVTKVEQVHEVGLVSSSLDKTIKIYDIGRGALRQTYSHHARGVHSFAWCSAYSLFASAGVERNITLWQPATNARKIGELIGHGSCVTHLAIDKKTNHLISLSLDRTLRVWDLRNHKCLQTIENEEWPKTADSKPSCMTYDKTRRRLVTCSNRIFIWPHKLVSQDKSGHRFPIKGAIYNSTFHVVVTADEEGIVCVWNLDSGSRESKFRASHGKDSKLTTLTFDSNERRLLTGATSGPLCMWNFNSGNLLREYKHDIEDLEITTAIFVSDERRGSDMIIAAGWNSQIFLWEDDDEDEVVEYKQLVGHNEDVLHMSALVEKDLLATGDYEGRIIIWNLSTGYKRTSLYHRADRYETSIDRLLWLPTKNKKNGEDLLLLLSAGGDGIIRVWEVGSHPKLHATLDGAHGRSCEVSTVIRDGELVVVGDSSGNIRVWDISNGVDLSTRISVKESFQQIAHWQGHSDSVSGLDLILLESEEWLVISCSKDTSVCLWTVRGQLVGTFGVDSWRLDDPATWNDADSIQDRPVNDHMEDIYVLEEKEKHRQDAVPQKEKHDEDLLRFERTFRQRQKRELVESTVHSQLKLHALSDPSRTLHLTRNRSSL